LPEFPVSTAMVSTGGAPKHPSPFLTPFFFALFSLHGAKYRTKFLFAGQAQMKFAIAVFTCIVILYLLDAAFFNGVYFAGVSRMLSDISLHIR
jgi:hypothetical protein